MPKENSYIGKQIGNYRVVAQIGDGSFGSVYRGHHIFLTNRIVAIKLLHLMHLTSLPQREDFLREARFLEELNHPHILPIIDVGIEEGFPYLITHYASNGSLRDRLKRQGSRPLPLEEAVTILLQIGQALQHAHLQNIVHRDLKPANILFDTKGEALLADFGIATMLDTANTARSAPIVGTPSYMAPEQFRGIVSKASDQYALGCIAYELFTGRKPFIASDMFMFMHKHSTENPVAPTQLNSNLPVYIEQAILKAMAKERKDRYADVSAFIVALHISTVSSSVSQKAQEYIPSISSEELSPTENPVIDKCPYCDAETQPGDNFCLNCGNRLLPATPSYQQATPLLGDATIPGSDNWGGPNAPAFNDRTAAESAAVRDDGTAKVQATLDKIENPACFILRDDKSDVLQEYHLEKLETVIGRAPSSDILLSEDKLTSRRHAVVRYENGNYVLSDERSANGTFVNGQQLEELTPRILRDGDHIGIGEYELIFRTATSTGLEDLPTIEVPSDTAAKQLTYYGTGKDELVITTTDDQPLPKQIDAGTIGTRFMSTIEGQFGTAAAIPMNPPEELAPVDDLKSIAHDTTASSHPPPSPYSSFALDQNIEQLLEEGELHYKAKHYEDALAAFKRVIQMDPRNARAYGYKGNVLGKHGKYKDALAAYDAALAIDPNHASIWSAKGDVLSKLRRYESALVAYDGALYASR